MSSRCKLHHFGGLDGEVVDRSKGTSATQDSRFSDKEKKLMKVMKFEEALSTKVDMTKVKLDVLKPWIADRVNDLLGMEDDVVTEFIFNQLEVWFQGSSRQPTRQQEVEIPLEGPARPV